MMTVKGSESELVGQMVKALNLVPGVLAWRQLPGHYMTMHRTRVTIGPLGAPDIMGVRNGKAFGVEVKKKTGKQEESQKAFEKTFRAVGAEYVIARSMEELEKEIKRWLQERLSVL